MTTETTATPAESTAAPVIDTRPPPKSDAEAAQREAEDTAAKGPKEPATAAPANEDGAANPDGAQPKAGEQKKNRTAAYIQRLQDRVRELESRSAPTSSPTHDPRALASSQAPGAEEADAEPTLEQFDYDPDKYHRAYAQWAVRNAQKQQQSETEAASAREAQQKMFDAYNERLAAFEAEHPDFQEAINSIEYDLSKEVGVAILGHERGPEIAYYVANNDDEAFTLANTLPQNAAAAVARLVKRMDAAQQASQPASAAAPAAPVVAATPAAKPISKAPAPTPTLSGRTPGEVPPEKMTDDQWYAKERERQRKR